MRLDLEKYSEVSESWAQTGPGSRGNEILHRLLAVAGVMRGVPLELNGPLLAWRTEDNQVQWLKLFDGLVVGRSPNCDLVQKSKHVSRRHLRFHLRAEGVTVEDIKSSNGTKINGRLLEEADRFLVSGDVIDCGGGGLVFVG